ncbi:DUF2332 domain-containing protein [Loktanella sp. R86503]|uniref:DUF2332 domain-containing protein n=1 Tax=Loktanella sp. R86503 TaxID=3093847 RepID=UPI0036D94B48
MTTAGVSAAFLDQATHCANMQSAFMARLCTLLAGRTWPEGRIKDRVMLWTGDIGPKGQSVPLRLCGALHALRLNGDDQLALAYPPHDVSDNTLWQAVSAALVQHADFIDSFIDSAPQTNEVRRAAGIIAAMHWLHIRCPLPFRLTELGASGGLNLMCDHFALSLPQTHLGPADAVLTLSPTWTGPVPPRAAPVVIDRYGVDLNPLNPRDPDNALRLQAYLWADQPQRLDMTRAAMKIAEAPVARADAIDGLIPRLPHISGQLHLIYHTIAWQYFPTDRQTLGRSLIEAAGANATDDSPLAWLGLEADGTDAPGAALTLRLWPRDVTVQLARMDFHGRWVDWIAPD